MSNCQISSSLVDMKLHVLKLLETKARCPKILNAHKLVGMSSVVVMTQMHGENQLKKQKKTKIFDCNLESKNLSMHLRHHHTNSRQITSVRAPHY